MRFFVRHAWLFVISMLGSLALIAAPASAGSVKNVSGSGVSNYITCPDGGTGNGVSISFGATTVRGVTEEGGFGLDNYYTADNTFKEGDAYSATISRRSFSITGTTFEDECGGNWFPTPVTFTISGKCGTNAVFSYRDANGENGYFYGSVSCTI